MDATTKTVLLAEDDPILRKAAGTILRRNGFNVVLAPDGAAALDAACNCRPDLILLDLIMPKMDGFEVLLRLKSEAATANVPVIILSNLGQTRDLQKAKDLGALDYLVKSNLPLDEILRRVRAALGMVGEACPAS